MKRKSSARSVTRRSVRRTEKDISQSILCDPLPLVINLNTFTEETLPPHWGSAKAAKEAARGSSLSARYMGHVELRLSRVQESDMKDITSSFIPTETYNKYWSCDDAGEFPSVNQIPISRLDKLRRQHHVVMAPGDRDILESLVALQSPISSPWKQPLSRLFTQHIYTSSDGVLVVKVHVYFSRLVFELISDTAIKNVVDNIRDAPCTRVYCTPKATQPRMFTKTDAELQQLRQYRFSLQGLLRHVESVGYGDGSYCEPRGLRVPLYDFQKSTCQWMLDQELDERGLNGRFWEEWTFNDGGPPMYYFPLAGEFRFDKPPLVKGGLLCEEMGLGKTVEVISLILANPASRINPPQSTFTPNDASDKRKPPLHVSRATLIVVPCQLAQQWWDEINTRATCGTTLQKGEITVISMAERNLDYELVPAGDVRGIYFSNDEGDSVSVYTENVRRLEWGVFGQDCDDVEVRGLEWCTPGKIFRGTIYRLYMEGQEKVAVHVNFESQLNDIDIVLTTYDKLKRPRCGKLYRNIEWYRVVLDECQYIKVATNQIASMCANLVSQRRWMVSGTPLCSSIADLHGELNFLKIWPFSLANNKDGFWGKCIAGPYAKKNESSLRLLYELLDVVMMRHTKSQRYVSDNSPLVRMPSRTIEWRPFLLEESPDELFAYRYIECFAADAIEQWAPYMGGTTEFRNSYRGYGAIHIAQIRGLVGLLSRCLTHTSTVSLRNLDHLKRMLMCYRVNALVSRITDIPLMSAEDILQVVQSVGVGSSGGLNWQSNRTHASVAAHAAEQAQREDLNTLPLSELTSRVEHLGLPQPMSWMKLPYQVSVNRNSNTLSLYANPRKIVEDSPSAVKDSNEKYMRKLCLHKNLVIGDVVRVRWADRDDAEMTVDLVDDRYSDPHHSWREQVEDSKMAEDLLGEVSVQTRWSLDAQHRVDIYKHDHAKRKQPFVDLLISHSQVLRRPELCGKDASQLYEGGFSILYSLMAGQAVSCPLCLMEATRPTVTTCVHAYCYECIVDVVEREGEFSAKCPVCRRRIAANDLMEVKVDNIEEPFEEPCSSSENQNGINGVCDSLVTTAECESNSYLYPEATMNATSSCSEMTASHRPKEIISTTGSSDIEFLIPHLSCEATAIPTAELNSYIPQYNITSYRNTDFPSISCNALNVFQRPKYFFSARVTALLSDIEDVRRDDRFAKFVIYTHYNESAEIVEYALKSNEVQCVRMRKDSSGAINQQCLRKFNHDTECSVLILTTGVCATGLTLCAARVLYMLEPCHNATEEAQVISRVHRIGQTRSVKCVILYGKNTCEERLLALRQKNRTLTEVLSSDKCDLSDSASRRNGESDQSDGLFFSRENLWCLLGGRKERHEARETVAQRVG